MSRVHVTIDRLALSGFDAAERAALVDELQTELTRLLADPAMGAAWKRSRRTPVLRLGRVGFQPGVSGSRGLGRSVARAIGRSLKP
jgi:hypothetical protein